MRLISFLRDLEEVIWIEVERANDRPEVAVGPELGEAVAVINVGLRADGREAIRDVARRIGKTA